MTDQHSGDRAEQAFRDAFSARGGEAPQDPLHVPAGPRRRTWWVAGAAAAAVVAAVTVPAVVFSGDDPAPDVVDEPTSEPPMPYDARWVSHRGTEVAVPAEWGFDYEPVRPDCIRVDRDMLSDPWAGGTPTQPYVEVEDPYQAIPAIGCLPPTREGRGPVPFGDLPFELWQPHVLLGDPERSVIEGEWTHEGWTLVRRTVGEASVSVLTAPGDEVLGEQILDSAREVGTDQNGCPSVSPIQRREFQEPRVAIPVPEQAPDVIAVCRYARGDTEAPGLLGSRQITGAEADALVRAIHAAPRGGGPDRQTCVDDMYGDHAILLRFLPAGWTARDVAYPEAYVYYDWCFGNGVFDGTAAYALTKDNCKPLFAEPPILMHSASEVVAEVCWNRED